MSIELSYETECLATGGRRDRARDRGAHPQLGRVRRAAQLPSAKRSARSGRSSSSITWGPRTSRPAGHRRAASSAHRAGDGHISLRRRDHASRQPGLRQLIQPGAVNLMTAGAASCIRSARATTTGRHFAPARHPSWIALPSSRGVEPSFIHYPAATLPSSSATAARCA